MSSKKPDLHGLLSAILEQQQRQTELAESQATLVAVQTELLLAMSTTATATTAPRKKTRLAKERDAIKWARENDCTTMSEIARQFGVSKQATSKWTVVKAVVNAASGPLGWEAIRDVDDAIAQLTLVDS